VLEGAPLLGRTGSGHPPLSEDHVPDAPSAQRPESLPLRSHRPVGFARGRRKAKWYTEGGEQADGKESRPVPSRWAGHSLAAQWLHSDRSQIGKAERPAR